MPTVTEEPTADKAVKLAEENFRLAEENRQLKLAGQRREVAHFMAGLREAGQLTPAMELTGVEDALLFAEQSQLVVKLPDGSSVPLGEMIKEILRALPVSFMPKEVSTPEQAPPAITPEEEEIAQQLGLSNEEYLAIRAGS